VDKILLLWGKTSSDSYHPLLYHLLDVGNVTSVVWEHILTERIQTYISDAMGVTKEEAKRAFCYWSALHDIGKATPSFQVKNARMSTMLASNGYSFSGADSSDKISHGELTTRIVPVVLHENGLATNIAYDVAYAIGAHHGRWPNMNKIAELEDYQVGDENWWIIRSELGAILRDTFNPPSIYPHSLTNSWRVMLSLCLAGIVSAADWIGSDKDFFPYDSTTDLESYKKISLNRANRAVCDIVWKTWTPPKNVSFDDIGNYESLYPVQDKVLDISENLNSPCLVLIKSGTGTGKTEASIFLSAKLISNGNMSGMYMAMPTRLTSDAMRERIEALLNIPVVPVYSGKKNIPDSLKWFKGRRALLSQLGVGTIDQALLSAMPSPYFFLRMLGLTNKVVVFDEIHALDMYMSGVFFRLLQWLRLVDASVIVMTATLTEDMERKIIEAYTGRKGETWDMVNPGITVFNNDVITSYPIEIKHHKRIKVTFIDIENVSATALEKSRDTNVCIMCNTIDQAQSLYEETVKKAGSSNVYLLHSRLEKRVRSKVEEDVMRLFASGTASGAKGSVLIATQIVEQSLDLSFGLLISYLAPMDMLIQRLGRLKRHSKGKNVEADFYVIQPEITNGGVPRVDLAGRIYPQHLLLRTYLKLKNEYQYITLPDDTNDLMSVYGKKCVLHGNASEELVAYWKATYNMWRSSYLKLRQRADINSLFPPNEEEYVRGSEIPVTTRLGIPSVQVCCLYREKGILYVDREKTTALTYPISDELAEHLEGAIISISHPTITRLMKQTHRDPEWVRCRPLRYVYPLIVENGQADVGDYRLYVEKDLGVKIVNNK